MTIRHLIATVLTGLLVLAPSAAFAQDGDGEPETTEPSSWEALGEAIGQIFDEFLGARDAVDEDDEESVSGFEAVVETVETLVSDLFSTIYFQAAEAAAQDTAADLEGEGANGEAVSTLAKCAPRGSFGALIEGATNHGEYITAAAHGETVQLNVPTIVEDEDGAPVLATDGESGEPVGTLEDFDLTTTEGAEDLCGALDVVYQARLLELEVAWEEVDVHQDARVLVREQCQLQRLRERNGADVDAKTYCADLRQRVKDLHAEARDAAKAERDEARAEAKAARDAAKAERDEARAEARAQREAARGGS